MDQAVIDILVARRAAEQQHLDRIRRIHEEMTLLYLKEGTDREKDIAVAEALVAALDSVLLPEGK